MSHCFFTWPRFKSEGFWKMVTAKLNLNIWQPLYQAFLVEKGKKKSQNLLSRGPLEKPDSQTSLLKDHCISVIFSIMGRLFNPSNLCSIAGPKFVMSTLLTRTQFTLCLCKDPPFTKMVSRCLKASTDQGALVACYSCLRTKKALTI